MDFMNSTSISRSGLTVEEVLKLYSEGKREFRKLDFVNTMSFANCELDDIDFSGSFMDGTFVNASLRNAKFYLASIKTVEFENCDLTFANFKMSGLEAASFENCKVAHACFDHASIYEPLKLGEMPPEMTR